MKKKLNNRVYSPQFYLVGKKKLYKRVTFRKITNFLLRCWIFPVFLMLLVLMFTNTLLSATKITGDCESPVAQNGNSENALNETIYDLIKKLDLGALEKYTDELKREFGEDFDLLFGGTSCNTKSSGLNDQNIGKRLLAFIDGESFGYGNFFTQLKLIFFKDVKDMLPYFATIGAVALLSGVFSAIKSTAGGKSTENVTFLITFSVVLLPVLTLVSVCFMAAKTAVTAIEKQIQIIFPILLTLMNVSGNSATAAIYTPAAAFVSTSAISLVRGVLLPVSIAIAAFSVAGNLSPQLKLNRFGAFFKSIYKWIIGIVVSVFGLFFTAQGLGAAAFDNAAKRAAKYMIGAGVPIVGGFLSGGFDLALAGSVLIKNSVGYFGMLLLLIVMMKPLILLVATNVLLKFTAAITQPLGDARISDFLGETAENANYCLAGVIMAAFMYFVMLILCVCCGEAML